ncbi:MAG: hypothetical protein KFF73_11405 [Cyclobacteriaceae bacterium]|nr:hypothetical protein [Cyclobacteriaceae bacterium]
MKEEKLDRIIRKMVNDHFIPEPSRDFVDKVMGELGVKPAQSTLKTKPLKSRRGLILMGVLYLAILITILVVPGALESSSYNLPEFKLPSLSEYFNISQNLSKMLILLILGGWILIFFDRYIRKFFMR